MSAQPTPQKVTSTDGTAIAVRCYARATDFDAVSAHALQDADGLPLCVVGHNLGAQLSGMLAHRDRIGGLVSIAAGSGHWRDNAPRLKRVALYFRYALVAPADASTGRTGHFGLFRDQFQSTLWARVATLLQGFPMFKETA